MVFCSCFAVHEWNILLLGGTDKEKTCLGNFITRKKAFRPRILFSDKYSEFAKGEWGRKTLTVVKTPDIFDPSLLSVTKEMMKSKTLCSPGPTVILLIVTPSDFTEEKRQALKAILSMFGPDALKHSMVIITETENKMKNYSSVENIIQDCNRRQHTIKLDQKDLHKHNAYLLEHSKLMVMIETIMTDNTQPATNTGSENSSVHYNIPCLFSVIEGAVRNSFSGEKTNMKPKLKDVNKEKENSKVMEINTVLVGKKINEELEKDFEKRLENMRKEYEEKMRKKF